MFRRLSVVALFAASRGVQGIFGGAPTLPGTFPGFANILFSNEKGGHFCGGFLVHPSFVMTAGSCVINGTLLSYMVTLDDANRTVVGVSAKFTHPAFLADGIKSTSDVGLLQLTQPSSVPPLAYARDTSVLASLSACAAVTIIGSGATSDFSGIYGPLLLRMASIDFIPPTAQGATGCIEQPGGSANYGFQIPLSQVGDDVCLGAVPPCSPTAVGSPRACSGDGGGPALAPDGTAFALASRGEAAPCEQQIRPQIYTNIGARENAAWIEAVLSGANLTALNASFFAPPPPPLSPFLPSSPPVGSSTASDAVIGGAVGGAIGGCAALCIAAVCCTRARRVRAAHKPRLSGAGEQPLPVALDDTAAQGGLV